MYPGVLDADMAMHSQCISFTVLISCVGDGVMKYDVMRVLTAGRHLVEVIVYCKGAPVSSEKHNFRGSSDDDM